MTLIEKEFTLKSGISVDMDILNHIQNILPWDRFHVLCEKFWYDDLDAEEILDKVNQ